MKSDPNRSREYLPIACPDEEDPHLLFINHINALDLNQIGSGGGWSQGEVITGPGASTGSPIGLLLAITKD